MFRLFVCSYLRYLWIIHTDFLSPYLEFRHMSRIS
jgi:hypothetical protein